MKTRILYNDLMLNQKYSAVNPPRHAFSLVELSIVLVILGLLVGGILSGQSLIRAAELRTIATQYNQYVTATQTFRDKYFAIPGDMTNATSFWGAADGSTGNTVACKTTVGTGTQTCNGNGDGMVNAVPANSSESFRLWQHLANAGLIEGTYDGIVHGSTPYSATTANSPKGRISGTAWFVFNWATPLSGDPGWFDGDYGNRLAFGFITPNAEPGSNMMTGAEMWNLDTKIDDGKPGRGRVMAGWPTCTNAANSADLDTTYVLTSTSSICRPNFARAF